MYMSDERRKSVESLRPHIGGDFLQTSGDAVLIQPSFDRSPCDLSQLTHLNMAPSSYDASEPESQELVRARKDICCKPF